MNRHEKRLQTLQAQLSEVESLIENLQDKIRRNNFKKDRKKWRKKMATDMYFRIMQQMQKSLETDLYEGPRTLGMAPALGMPFGSMYCGLAQQVGVETSRYSAKDGINAKR